MAKNATPWIKMIRAVYASFGTGAHQGDPVARRVMDRVVSWLVEGKCLSPKLQDKLIDNINMRTKYQVAQPDERVRLTRDQIAYARKTNPEWFGLGLDGQDEVEDERKGAEFYDAFPPQSPEITLPLRQFCDVITTPFRMFCDAFPTEALALAQHLVAMAAEKRDSSTIRCVAPNSKLMESEENETNHEWDMSYASKVMIHDEPLPAHEAQEDSAIPLSDEGISQEQTPAPRKPCVTIWVKPDQRGTVQASGYLDANNQKFSIKFTAFDHALDRIGQGDREWYQYMARDIAPAAVATERASTGIASRATMSGLYDGINDTKAFKSPVACSTAVMLEWDGDVPISAWLLDATDVHKIDPQREAGNRYKGLLH